MILMHSRPKEQREAIRQLVHSVLTRDMATFNPERFKEWIKEIDARFRKVGLTLLFTIRDGLVTEVLALPSDPGAFGAFWA